MSQVEKEIIDAFSGGTQTNISNYAILFKGICQIVHGNNSNSNQKSGQYTLFCRESIQQLPC